MEGPSVHALADDLQHLVGQRVVETAGNAREPIEALEGREITRVEAIKKRLVLRTGSPDELGPAAVVHFLMYGTWRLNERRDREPRLSLRLTGDELNVYSCSAKVLEGDALAELDPTGDVLREGFDADRARKALTEDRIVADILLDQDVFGGVGNIVKNEALFRAGVHPRRSGVDLSKEERAALFDANVGLARRWYEDPDGARAIIRIYRKASCPACGSATEKAEVGVLERITTWCPTCQPPQGEGAP